MCPIWKRILIIIVVGNKWRIFILFAKEED
jgi:hypothetical protein